MNRFGFVPYPLLVGLCILIALLVALWREKRRPIYLFGFSIFWLYLLLVVGLTIFPIPLPGARQPVTHLLSRINLMPFSFGGLFNLSPGVIFANLAGNILLTLPLGFSLGLIFRIPARRLPWLAVATGVSLEMAQLVVSLLVGVAYRGIDINDTILNALGVLIGYGFFRVLARLYRAVIQHLGRGASTAPISKG